jgi:hypothetical protein
MAATFLYLTFWSIRNRVRLRLRGLRQPRYVVGSIVGVLYFYLMVFRRLGSPGPTAGPVVGDVLARAGGTIEFLGTMFLLIAVVSAWILPGLAKPIEFTRPEVQFLFTAPLSRRQLLHYKLLRTQLGAIFSSIVATIFLGRGSLGHAWMLIVGFWVMFAIFRLHFTGIALRRLSLTRHGPAGMARQWLPVFVLGAGMLVLVAAVIADWPGLSSMTTLRDLLGELRRLASIDPARWVLWPFQVVVRLPLSPTRDDFLRVLWPSLGLLVLNYAWVMRSDSSFEESSAAHAEQRASQPAERRTMAIVGRRRVAPFDLATTGRPESAILWKNLILLGRYASARTLLRVALAFGVVVLAFSRVSGGGDLRATAAMIALVAACLTVLLGPQLVRNDLRQDFANFALLKTWPVRGPALVRGEVLASSVLLTVIAWLLIATAALLVPAHGPDTFGLPQIASGHRWGIAMAAALSAPALILTQVLLHNGMAILFPAWVSAGVARSRGIDAIGQRLIIMGAVTLALTITLVPGLIVAWPVALVLTTVLHDSPVATAVIPVVVSAIVSFLLAIECWIVIELLGRVLDRTDISAVEVVEA